MKSYHMLSYHMISCHMISYHIISYHTKWCVIIEYCMILYDMISYDIILYHMRAYDGVSLNMTWGFLSKLRTISLVEVSLKTHIYYFTKGYNHIEDVEKCDEPTMRRSEWLWCLKDLKRRWNYLWSTSINIVAWNISKKEANILVWPFFKNILQIRKPTRTLSLCLRCY